MHGVLVLVLMWIYCAVTYTRYWNERLTILQPKSPTGESDGICLTCVSGGIAPCVAVVVLVYWPCNRGGAITCNAGESDLPPGWSVCKDIDGDQFYVNEVTGLLTFDNPRYIKVPTPSESLSLLYEEDGNTEGTLPLAHTVSLPLGPDRFVVCSHLFCCKRSVHFPGVFLHTRTVSCRECCAT